MPKEGPHSHPEAENSPPQAEAGRPQGAECSLALLASPWLYMLVGPPRSGIPDLLEKNGELLLASQDAGGDVSLFTASGGGFSGSGLFGVAVGVSLCVSLNGCR